MMYALVGGLATWRTGHTWLAQTLQGEPVASQARTPVQEWNHDKPHRCPECHAVAIDTEDARRLAVYECCRCQTLFSRFPSLGRLLPKRGVRCSEHNPRLLGR